MAALGNVGGVAALVVMAGIGSALAAPSLASAETDTTPGASAGSSDTTDATDPTPKSDGAEAQSDDSASDDPAEQPPEPDTDETVAEDDEGTADIESDSDSDESESDGTEPYGSDDPEPEPQPTEDADPDSEEPVRRTAVETDAQLTPVPADDPTTVSTATSGTDTDDDRPAENPMAAAFLAWMRRLEAALVNDAPTANPTSIGSDPTTGEIFGNLGVVDIDGNRIAYRLLALPTSGSVRIDAVTGNWVYTPDAETALGGGIDGFTVTVDDVGFHLFDSVKTSTLFIPITITATPEAVLPTVTPTSEVIGNPELTLDQIWNAALRGGPFRGAAQMIQRFRTTIELGLVNKAPEPDPRVVLVDQETGVVYGTFNTVDANGDPLTFTVVDGPEFGTVQIDQANGTYVYIPNADIASTGGTDSFTIAIDDTGTRLFDSTGPVAVTVPLTITARTAPRSAVVIADVTRGFDIHNYTTKPLVLTRYKSGSGYSVPNGGGPKVGTVVMPGQSLHFEVTYLAGRQNIVGVEFSDTTAVGYVAEFRISPYLTTSVATRVDSRSTSVPGPGVWWDVTKVIFMDAPGTRISVNGSDSQSAILESLCNGLANCRFKAVGPPAAIWGPWVDAIAYRNATSVEQPLPELTDNQTTSLKHSFKVSAKVGLEIVKAIKSELSAEYSYEAVTTHSYAVKLSGKAPAWTKVVLQTMDPMLRYTGDMTVTFGNTSYVLQNVTFDVPDLRVDGSGVVSVTGRRTQYNTYEEKLPHPAAELT